MNLKLKSLNKCGKINYYYYHLCFRWPSELRFILDVIMWFQDRCMKKHPRKETRLLWLWDLCAKTLSASYESKQLPKAHRGKERKGASLKSNQECSTETTKNKCNRKNKHTRGEIASWLQRESFRTNKNVKLHSAATNQYSLSERASKVQEG